MKTRLSFALAAILLLAPTLSPASETLDPRLVGAWQGMREASGECRFLAWNSTFFSDGRFEITFFADKKRRQPIQSETGRWKASDGRSELRTEGVSTPEVYLYTVINENTVAYENTVKDPTADCQEDYAFTEYRVRK